MSDGEARTGADVVLAALQACGVDWVFCNAGTDFPPIIEAILRAQEEGRPLPRMVPVLHEHVAVSMAHGYYLATGRRVGVKPAGGIRTAKEALQYLVMVKETAGDDWLSPALFRFGAAFGFSGTTSGGGPSSPTT